MMTKDEKSLILFLETQAVDNCGRIDIRRMNDEDHQILKRWTKSGFVESGRVCAEDLSMYGKPEHLWVRLSPRAFEAAHKERIARAKRLWERRRWRTSEEKRGTEV